MRWKGICGMMGFVKPCLASLYLRSLLYNIVMHLNLLDSNIMGAGTNMGDD